jgi:uncharacterized membrane protein
MFDIFIYYAKINNDMIIREVNVMRYFWTFFWTFLLMQMLTYVVSSMSGASYDLTTGTILAVVTTILIFILSTIIPNEPSEHEAH